VAISNGINPPGSPLLSKRTCPFEFELHDAVPTPKRPRTSITQLEKRKSIDCLEEMEDEENKRQAELKKEEERLQKQKEREEAKRLRELKKEEEKIQKQKEREAEKERKKLEKEKQRELERQKKEQERIQKQKEREAEKLRKEKEREEERIRKQKEREAEKLRKEKEKEEERLRKQKEREAEKLRKEKEKEEEKLRKQQERKAEKLKKEKEKRDSLRRNESALLKGLNAFKVEHQIAADCNPKLYEMIEMKLPGAGGKRIVASILPPTDSSAANKISNRFVNQVQEEHPELSCWKLFSFDERPAFARTFSKKSDLINGRRPFARDESLFDYEMESDEEWEEGGGEDIANASDEEETDPMDAEEYDEFLVPDGYLSEEEGLGDLGSPCTNTRANEAHFTSQKPRCTEILYQFTEVNPEYPVVAIEREFPISESSIKEEASKNKSVSKLLRPVTNDSLPDLVQLLHNSTDGVMKIINCFKTKHPEISKRQIEIKMKEIATKQSGKWSVNDEELVKKYCTDSKDSQENVKPQTTHILTPKSKTRMLTPKSKTKGVTPAGNIPAEIYSQANANSGLHCGEESSKSNYPGFPDFTIPVAMPPIAYVSEPTNTAFSINRNPNS